MGPELLPRFSLSRLLQQLWQSDWLLPFVASSFLVVLAVAFAQTFVTPSVHGPQQHFIECMVRWDGTYYRDIARDGYRYNPGHQSTIHFWPLYPLLGRGLALVTGLRVEYALVIISHLAFATAMILLGRYVELRYGPGTDQVRSTALLVLAFLPPSLFFHMGYTESLFLLFCVLELYLIERGAHPLLITVIAGLAIVTRPPGIALLAPLVVYVLRREKDLWQAAGWLCICLPLALSGFVAFLFYSDVAFNDPLAPIRNRTFLWRMRELPSLPEKVVGLLTLLPAWEIFDPSSPGYWSKWVPSQQLLFSIYPTNPFYFVASVALLGLGIARRWLNYAEILLTIFLLLIPYLANGYETFMVSMARYSMIAPPLYLVLGRLLIRVSPTTLVVLAVISSFFLAIYAAQFAQGYWII